MIVSNTQIQLPILSVQSLSVAFGSQSVLKDISLELYDTENLIVMGKSGVGKSVLIKCIIGLVKANAGKILINGIDMLNSSKFELEMSRNLFGFLFQTGALYDSMTVRQNLEFPLRRRNFKLSKREISILVDETLDDVGLRQTVDLLPEDLSGGMRKRIGLARTLITRPKIMLYDEPTTGLDSITSREILALINDVKKKYSTSAIIITHDNLCVKMNADRVLLLFDGKVHAQGTYNSMLNSSDPILKQFFYI
jgi:phospholipid/cholesterol/gamma-HCH transport system ATP-binding protein